MYFWTSWPQRANLWNAEMSQTDAIFAQTSDQLIFSTSKVERATATDLSWLSTYSYKKDRTQQSPLKGCWPGAQWDKKHRAQSLSVFLIFHPVSVLRMRPWGGLSGVDGWAQTLQTMCAAAAIFFISCFFLLHRLFVALTIMMLWIRPLAPNTAPPPSPPQNPA